MKLLDLKNSQIKRGLRVSRNIGITSVYDSKWGTVVRTDKLFMNIRYDDGTFSGWLIIDHDYGLEVLADDFGNPAYVPDLLIDFP
jgi:hypothetical protein